MRNRRASRLIVRLLIFSSNVPAHLEGQVLALLFRFDLYGYGHTDTSAPSLLRLHGCRGEPQPTNKTVSPAYALRPTRATTNDHRHDSSKNIFNNNRRG